MFYYFFRKERVFHYEKDQLVEVDKKDIQDDETVDHNEKSHEVNSNVSCYCGSTFSSREELLDHSKKKHGQRKPFTCGDCGKSFVFKQVKPSIH